MKKLMSVGIVSLLCVALLLGCASPAPSEESTPETVEPTAAPTVEITPEPTPEPSPEPVDFASLPLVRVASLQGPTGMGMVGVMDQNDKETSSNRYEFSLAAAPDEIVAMLTSGEVDVASIPTNLAASLYQATGGSIQLATINTLGVLYILERGDTIHSVKDLEGKTILATAQGTTTEHTLSYILKANDIEDAFISFLGEHAELMTLAASGVGDIIMLPEPFVTNLMAQTDEFRIALDISEEWEKVAGSQLAMSGIAVRKEFAQQNKEALDGFLSDYYDSVAFVRDNVSEAAALVEQYGVIPSAAVAEKALPNCNIVFLASEEMKNAAEKYCEVLYEANPKAIGGEMPGDDFYYFP